MQLSKLRTYFWQNKSYLLWLILFALIATSAVWEFYFWHDDFNVFYSVRTKDSVLGWPYDNFMPIIGTLYEPFGYNPMPYFALGIITFIIYILTFFFLLKRFFNSDVSTIVSTLLATAYIGGGVFQEAYGPIISFPPLILLILSILLFVQAVQDRLRAKTFIAATIIYSISVIWFYARTSTFFVPAVAGILIFSNKVSKSKLTLLVITLLVVFYLAFIVLPLGLDKPPVISNFATQANLMQKVYFFFVTLGTIFFPDDLRLSLFQSLSVNTYDKIIFFTGLGLLLLYLLVTFKDRKLKTFKLRLFALIWILALYLPYGLRASWRLEATNRYVIFMYPGILIAWATFHKLRLWKYVSLMFIVTYLFLGSRFLFAHRAVVQKQAAFYKQLHVLLPQISEDSVIYVDFPLYISQKVNDFFRVGTTPPESAIGAEYGVLYKNIRLYTESEVFRRHIEEGKIKRERLNTFYYDGTNLQNTTDLVHKALDSSDVKEAKINLSAKAVFLENSVNKSWTSTTDGVEVFVNNFIPVIASKFYLEIAASIPDFTIPYSVDCAGCPRDISNKGQILNYLYQERVLSQGIKNITSSESGDNTSITNAIDDRDSTFWIAEGTNWRKGQVATIDVQFSSKVTTEGVIFKSSPSGFIPKDVAVKIDGVKSESSQENIPGGSKVTWQQVQGSKLNLEIISTNGGDVPLITELYFIPGGHSNISISEIEHANNYPASAIGSEEDKNILKEYLVKGTTACLQWYSNYGSGSEKFILMADGKRRTYEIDLPGMGIDTFKFSVGCLNFPIDISVESYKIRYIDIGK